jgi:hypothetical protein
MDDYTNCKAGIIQFPYGKTMEGQTVQVIYGIRLREEFAKMNKLTGSITFSSGIQTRASNKSMVDSLVETIICEYELLACQ